MLRLISKLISLAFGLAILGAIIFLFAIHRPEEKTVSANGQTETVMMDETKCTVQYVAKETLYPAFGRASGNSVSVRDDLEPNIKKFVRVHELYHCWDTAKWGGWIGREIRANLIAGDQEFKGFMAAAWQTVSDYDRLKYYWERVKNWE